MVRRIGSSGEPEQDDTPVVRKHPDAKCEECPLFRRRMVPSSYSSDGRVDIAWVGEAPARNEVAQGANFVGDSGAMLWTTAKHVGLYRDEHASVHNSVLCQPIGKNPGAEELAACRPRLLQELADAKPKVVVTMGNYALAQVTGMAKSNVKITQERGKPREIEVDGVELLVFPTLHPASLLYNAGGFPDFTRDLEEVARIVGGTSTERDKDLPVLDLIDTPEKYADFLQRVEHDPEFEAKSTTPYARLEAAADLETGGFDYSQGGDEILCMSMSFDSKIGQVVSEELINSMDGRKLTRRLLDRDDILWTWQNGAFDANFLMRDIGDFPMAHDTMILHYATDERRGTHSLEQMSFEFEDAPDYKHMLDQYLPNKNTSYRVIPRDVLYEYAAYDAVYTRRLRFTLEAIARRQKEEAIAAN